MFLEFRKWKNGNFVCLLQMENGNGKLPFVAVNENIKQKFVFLWSANDKRLSTIVVSANVPIYSPV
jgi:hypothetical protein